MPERQGARAAGCQSGRGGCQSGSQGVPERHPKDPRKDPLEESKDSGSAAPVRQLALISQEEESDDQQSAATAEDATEIEVTWPKWSKVKGHKSAEVFAAIQGALEVMRGKPIALATKCGSDAKSILSLWRAVEEPDFPEFGAELKLVAEAFQDCPDPIFARNVRAEDWPAGTNRKRHVSQLCRHDVFADRLDAARRWDDEGRPTTSAATGLNGYTAEAEKAWGHLVGKLIRSGRLPEQLHPEPAKNVAYRAAIEAVGWSNLGRADDFGLRQMKGQFLSAYADARHTGDHR